MSPAEFLFWSSLTMVFYAYGGYPVILRVLAFFKADAGIPTQSTPASGSLPKVSLLISAYNEESVIEAKILNSLSLKYPNDLLEIIVISDGSQDGTNEIVTRYAGEGVVLRHYEGRIGKTACLNHAVPLAQGEIIVFSDANSEYDQESLRELVKHFSDPSIGFVTGWTKYRPAKPNGGTSSIGIYAKLELLTKRLESRIGSCVGADGAIFAIRKELYQPLKAYDINDFIIPLSIIRQGSRGILEVNAFCFEREAEGRAEEFNRQVRISNRTIRAILNNRALLNPWKFGIFSFELFSHKLCRFLVPLFLISLFLSNLFLSRHNSFFFIASLAQICLYLSAGLAKDSDKVSFISKIIAPAHTFVVVNFAILIAWIRYFQGEMYTTWASTQR